MNKLKEIRMEKGFTREALAKATGVTARAIKHWEDGSVPLEKAAYISVRSLADSLDVNPEELLGWKKYEKKHYGEWLDFHGALQCSACGYLENYERAYCPNCGIKIVR